MRKLVIIFLALTALLSLVGCGGEAPNSPDKEEDMVGWHTVPNTSLCKVVTVLPGRLLVELEDEDGDFRIWVDNQYQDVTEGSVVLVQYNEIGRYYVNGIEKNNQPVQFSAPEPATQGTSEPSTSDSLNW